LKEALQSKVVSSAAPPRWRLLGQANILGGEDAAAYEELHTRICAAVKPIDIIEEMFIADVASLQWEVSRWRRLKLSLIQARGLEALEEFLSENLDYDLYADYFADDLAEILQDNLPEDEATDAQTLAHRYAENESDAVDKVHQIRPFSIVEMPKIRKAAQARKASELAREYARGEPDAVTLVHRLLADAGKSMDAFMADALAKKLDDIERIDRLTTIAEGRRNDGLNQIERRRVLLGETLRRRVQEIEDGEFEVIEAPAKGKNAA
jgi:hypothetical protein